MTDFVERVVRPEPNDFPVRSLLDVDFYKPTMDNFIEEYYPGAVVRFELINRNKRIPLARVIPEDQLREALDNVISLQFRRTDLYYLRGMDVYGARMFPESYLSFLGGFRMTGYTLERDGDQYRLVFEGPWERVTWWETIALAVISELYYRNLMSRMPKRALEIMYARASNKLYNKLTKLKQHKGLKFADFGQRRRHSFLWQKYAIEMARDVMGDQFTGTSNTWMAFNQDLVPIGTNAHELPMVVTALRVAQARREGLKGDEFASMLRSGQYEILPKWQELYGTGLRIVLPDTYGSDQFYRNMPEELAYEIANNWRGQRQDSGDPSSECNKYINWLRKFGINDAKAAGKVNIFSDGLDVGEMLKLYEEFKDSINVAFGWGTNFTNDFRGCCPIGEEVVPGFEDLGLTWDDLFVPFSIVCKVTGVTAPEDDFWTPAVKLSNNPGKATGPQEEVDVYNGVCGDIGRVMAPVEV